MGKRTNIFGGVALGVLLSQFPEYSQQYVQRLGGAVGELTTVVNDFDQTAKSASKTRQEALSSMVGDTFLEGRRIDMERTISRQERLADSYSILRPAGPFERLIYVQRFADPKIAKSAMSDFSPAIPLNWVSLALLFGGYTLGFAMIAGLGHFYYRVRIYKGRRLNTEA